MYTSVHKEGYESIPILFVKARRLSTWQRRVMAPLCLGEPGKDDVTC